MSESAYFLILLFMGIMFVSPAFMEQEGYVQACEVRQNKQEVEELFEVLFGDTSKEEENLIPEGTRLIDFKFENGSLTLNFSEEIKNYGGTLKEQWIVYKILSTGFSIEGVQSITVLIEGQKDYLPEGTMIDAYEKKEWLEERMKSEWNESTKEITQKLDL